jgi:hypothetical protein
MSVLKLPVGVLIAMLLTGSISAQRPKEPPPRVTISGIPPAGEGGPGRTEPISGTASGPDLRNLRIVIYAYAGGQWWVQPTVASPLTPIDAGTGKWDTDTHLGRSYAALLVRSGYKAPATSDGLPEVGSSILARDVVAGRR